jgi:hypothetical protein
VPQKKKRNGWQAPVPDPTPQEILERCREIRLGWDSRTRRTRRLFNAADGTIHHPTPFMPQTVEVRALYGTPDYGE